MTTAGAAGLAPGMTDRAGSRIRLSTFRCDFRRWPRSFVIGLGAVRELCAKRPRDGSRGADPDAIGVGWGSVEVVIADD